MTTQIPHAALVQHLIALGKTGSGKSSKLRVLVEELLTIGSPVCIIDPKGDWWGLKSSADGKKSGFPLVIFGGEHGDVPINEHSGAHVAELVATGNRSCLIDLGGWMIGARTRFFIDFASTLFKMTRGPRHLVIDEVHNFAPQGKVLDPDAGKMLHWANRLASEGRGKGLTILAASQRPQKVHKDFLTSCETLIACKVIHKLDRDAIKDWIDGCADPAAGKQVIAELAQLKKPEAWVWSPEIDFGPERVTFPMFQTYDSFKPQAADAGKLKGWADVDLDEVKAKLVKVVEEAKASDPKALRAEIATLKKQLANATTANAGAGHDEDRAYERGKADGDAAGYARGLVNGYAGFDDLAINFRGLVNDLLAEVDKCQPAEAMLRQKLREKESAAAVYSKVKVAAAAQNPRRIPHPSPPRAAPATRHGVGPSGGGSLPKGEVATLAACIQYPDGLRREQLTVLTGYKRSSRDAYIQRLSGRGFIAIAGDKVIATDEGIAALPDFEPLPTGQALIDFWMAKLPEGERKVLGFLIEANGEPVDRGEIDTVTGYQRSSRDAYLQRLRAKQLVVDEGRGQVKASAELFG